MQGIRDFLDAGLIEEACAQFGDALAKTDGDTPPPDFVTGPAASEPAALIEELLTRLSCA